MKIIIDRRVEEEVLRCNSCNKNIGKSMWRAFLDGIIIDDGDEEDDKYRGCCHQHLCDYRAFLESLEGNNEELRQEINFVGIFAET